MNPFETNDLGRRRARAAGQKIMDNFMKAEPGMRTSMALIYEEKDDWTPEQKKQAAILRVILEEGIVAMGQEVLEAADAEEA